MQGGWTEEEFESMLYKPTSFREPRQTSCVVLQANVLKGAGSMCLLDTERIAGQEIHYSMRAFGVRQTNILREITKCFSIRIRRTGISTCQALTKVAAVRRIKMKCLCYDQGVGPVWWRMCIGNAIPSFMFVELSWVTICWKIDVTGAI
jgi:hypothetical protein